MYRPKTVEAQREYGRDSVVPAGLVSVIIAHEEVQHVFGRSHTACGVTLSLDCRLLCLFLSQGCNSVVVFTSNRSFYPTTSAVHHPVSVLILHPTYCRDTNSVVTQTAVRQRDNQIRKSILTRYTSSCICFR